MVRVIRGTYHKKSVHLLYRETLDVEPHTESSTTANIGIVSNLQKIAHQLIDDLKQNTDSAILKIEALKFTDSLESLWETVQSGKVKVESIALLRVIRNITCRDLHDRVIAPSLDKSKMASDLGLFVNQLNFVLKPKLSQ